MGDRTQFLQSAEKWDRKYREAAMEAIMAFSPDDETAEHRIKLYLSKERAEQLNLANSYSRALFRVHLLMAASELERELYQSGRIVMMATFVDQDWAFSIQNIGFDFKVAKQKVRNAFEGFDFIGAFEPAVYPKEKRRTKSGTGSLVSFHAHVMVWSTSESKLRRHKVKIAKRFTPLAGDEKLSFPTLHNLKTILEFRKSLRYVSKMPVEGYERIEENDEVRQRHTTLDNVHYFRLVDFLRHYSVFDAWFAGGEGSQILKSAKSRSIEAAKAKGKLVLFDVVRRNRDRW
jgi:hypothetical protein